MFAPSSPAAERRLDERRPPGGSSRPGQPLPASPPSPVKRVVSLGQTDVPARFLLRGKAVRRRRARPPGKRRDPIVARVQLYTIATQNSPINTRADWVESAHHRSLSPSLLSFPVHKDRRFLPRARAVVLPRLRPCTRSRWRRRRRRRASRPRTTRARRPVAPRLPSRCRHRLPSPPGPPGSATASTTAATVSAPSLFPRRSRPVGCLNPSSWLIPLVVHAAQT
jgi:hypothetical protein